MAKISKTAKPGTGRARKARPSATANKAKKASPKAKIRLPGVRVRSRAYVGLPPGICRQPAQHRPDVVELSGRNLHLNRLTVFLYQPGLRVEGVHL